VGLGRRLALVVAAMLPAAAARGLTPSEVAPYAQTAADVRAVGTAMMSWLTDQISFSEKAKAGSALYAASSTVDVANYPVITREDLAAILVPQYISAIPELDGWGHAYEYRLETSNFAKTKIMLVRSAGADGIFDTSVYTPGQMSSFDQDVVWADGFWVIEPGPSMIDVRERQRRVFHDLLNIGTAMMSWLTDNISFASHAMTSSTQCDLGAHTPISAASLATKLTPQYIQYVPELDPWGNPYDYYLDTLIQSNRVMAIRSRGRDGIVEGQVYQQGTFFVGDLDRDMVWCDGFYVQYPSDLDAMVFLDDFESTDTRFWSAKEP
jgi:hypothetical protein